MKTRMVVAVLSGFLFTVFAFNTFAQDIPKEIGRKIPFEKLKPTESIEAAQACFPEAPHKQKNVGWNEIKKISANSKPYHTTDGKDALFLSIATDDCTIIVYTKTFDEAVTIQRMLSMREKEPNEHLSVEFEKATGPHACNIQSNTPVCEAKINSIYFYTKY